MSIEHFVLQASKGCLRLQKWICAVYRKHDSQAPIMGVKAAGDSEYLFIDTEL